MTNTRVHLKQIKKDGTETAMCNEYMKFPKLTDRSILVSCSLCLKERDRRKNTNDDTKVFTAFTSIDGNFKFVHIEKSIVLENRSIYRYYSKGFLEVKEQVIDDLRIRAQIIKDQIKEIREKKRDTVKES